MKFHTPSFFIGAMFGSKKRQHFAYWMVFFYMLAAVAYLMYLIAYGIFYLVPYIIYKSFKASKPTDQATTPDNHSPTK